MTDLIGASACKDYPRGCDPNTVAVARTVFEVVASAMGYGRKGVSRSKHSRPARFDERRRHVHRLACYIANEQPETKVMTIVEVSPFEESKVREDIRWVRERLHDRDLDLLVKALSHVCDGRLAPVRGDERCAAARPSVFCVP